ncbi:MAG: hypothetical protein KJ899_11680, partial [Gammaproteobacteria bacterium]|nr:hypothetical protein [Gammaproteobacteria bacterium]
HAEIETGQLLQKLRKTHRINRYSQFALAASLLLAVGLWFSGMGSSVPVENAAKESSGIMVAQFAPGSQDNEAVILAGLKLSTELGASSQAAIEVEKEF